jgi:hypothetical protein
MIRGSVFGSRREKELFTSLHTQWGSQFDLWPSLPFALIVDASSLGPNFRESERDFFLKTSVDYTLCTKRGQPVLSIEFDGLGKGFSRQGEYVQQTATVDPYRKLKMDLKLRIAQNEAYSFFVVSFQESVILDRATNLTIVDGIIGQVLAKKEFKKSTETLYDDYREIIEALPPTAQYDYVQDLVLDAETIAELKWDPIAKLAAKLEYEAFEKGVVKSYGTEYLNDPELPDGDPYDFSVLEKRVEAMKNAVRVGCRITAKTPENSIVETVWLRNFEDTMVSALHIASNIAELLAFRRALDSAASWNAT